MNAAVWELVMLVVLPLLQLPLIVYLSRRVETDEESPPPAGWGDGVYPPDPNVSQQVGQESADASTPDRSPPSTPPLLSASPAPSTLPESAALSTPSTIVCRRCDADNDPEFTYCHDCVARL